MQEIKKYDFRVKVLFATSALGMGVDTPYVTNIIHISPPGTIIEAYMKETGRAGHMVGIQAKAVLYYNNSDIGKSNKYFSTLALKQSNKVIAIVLLLQSYCIQKTFSILASHNGQTKAPIKDSDQYQPFLNSNTAQSNIRVVQN